MSLTVRNGPGGTCEVYWGLTKVNQKELLDRAVKKLEDQIEDVGGVENITEENMPEAHIRGDVDTPYKCIGGGDHHHAAGRASSASASFPSRRRWRASAP